MANIPLEQMRQNEPPDHANRSFYLQKGVAVHLRGFTVNHINI